MLSVINNIFSAPVCRWDSGNATSSWLLLTQPVLMDSYSLLVTATYSPVLSWPQEYHHSQLVYLMKATTKRCSPRESTSSTSSPRGLGKDPCSSPNTPIIPCTSPCWLSWRYQLSHTTGSRDFLVCLSALVQVATGRMFYGNTSSVFCTPRSVGDGGGAPLCRQVAEPDLFGHLASESSTEAGKASLLWHSHWWPSF